MLTSMYRPTLSIRQFEMCLGHNSQRRQYTHVVCMCNRVNITPKLSVPININYANAITLLHLLVDCDHSAHHIAYM